MISWFKVKELFRQDLEIAASKRKNSLVIVHQMVQTTGIDQGTGFDFYEQVLNMTGKHDGAEHDWSRRNR
jgi:hypothetical protein